MWCEWCSMRAYIHRSLNLQINLKVMPSTVPGIYDITFPFIYRSRARCSYKIPFTTQEYMHTTITYLWSTTIYGNLIRRFTITC